LTKTINYQPVTAGNQSNPSAGFQNNFDAEKAKEESDQQYFLFPVWSFGSTNHQNTDGDAAFDRKEPEFDEKKHESKLIVSLSSSAQPKKQYDKTKKEAKGKSPIESFTRYKDLSAEFEDCFDNSINEKSSFIDASQLLDDPDMPKLEDITYSDDEDDVGAEADFNNLETYITVSLIPTTRVHKDHHVTQIIGDLSLSTQTNSMTWVAKDQGIKQDLSHKNTHRRKELTMKKSCSSSKDKSYKIIFSLCLLHGLYDVSNGCQECFLYGTIKKEVYVCQPPGFEDPDHPEKVFKVVKALYGLHQAPSASYETLANYLLENCFQRGKIDQTLFIKRQKDGKLASTPIDTDKPLLKDPDGEDVDVYTYMSMISSLMYLTSSRPDIMFAVCARACFQVTLKDSHLHAVKRIFRYLKGKPHLGLWYLKGSPFDLVAYSDSDFAGASLDRKSTTGGCQFLKCRLISWQCKTHIVVATVQA
nr:hypothetical protein [Tanacetum cinerariifolium]